MIPWINPPLRSRNPKTSQICFLCVKQLLFSVFTDPKDINLLAGRLGLDLNFSDLYIILLFLKLCLKIVF